VWRNSWTTGRSALTADIAKWSNRGLMTNHLTRLVGIILCWALAASAQQHGAAVQVTIAGGANAGTYSLKDSRSCQIDTPKGQRSRTLHAAVSDAAKVANPKTLGNAIFEIPLGTAGSASGLLDIDLIFGEPDKVAADYYVTTVSQNGKQGSGTVTFQERGGGVRLTFQAQTTKGVKFEGVLECFDARTK
jgi:hypothetical protein